jgi:hypothetical protein
VAIARASAIKAFATLDDQQAALANAIGLRVVEITK